MQPYKFSRCCSPYYKSSEAGGRKKQEQKKHDKGFKSRHLLTTCIFFFYAALQRTVNFNRTRSVVLCLCLASEKKASTCATEVEALAWGMWTSPVSPPLIWWRVWAWVYGSFLVYTCNQVYFSRLWSGDRMIRFYISGILYLRFCQHAYIAMRRTILVKSVLCWCIFSMVGVL